MRVVEPGRDFPDIDAAILSQPLTIAPPDIIYFRILAEYLFTKLLMNITDHFICTNFYRYYAKL